MNLFADENIPAQIVRQLRALGHDVLWAYEAGPALDDEHWLSRAAAEGRKLITDDKDFGELVFRKRLLTAGVVLFGCTGCRCASGWSGWKRRGRRSWRNRWGALW